MQSPPVRSASPPPSIGAIVRARKVLAEAGLKGTHDLVRAAHTVNEVWFAGPYVLRISPNRYAVRLHHEAEVARVLPPEVRYPEIVALGRSEAGEWMVSRRVEGEMLARAWPGMDDHDRRLAISQLARAMDAIHGVRSRSIGTAFDERDTLECPHQLPAGRVLDLLDRARRLRHVQRPVLDQAEDLVRDALPYLDRPDTPHGLVHGDLHLENVLWDGRRLSAVLDLEWARPAPPDLDLDVLLRFVWAPDQHVEADYRDRLSRSSFEDVPGWLAEDLPDLFAIPGLRHRLAVYALSYDIRALLLEPPIKPVDQLHPLHPWNRIRTLLSRRNHLAGL